MNTACPVSVFSAGRRNHSIHIVRSVTYLFQLLSHFRFKGTIFVLDTALPRVRFVQRFRNRALSTSPPFFLLLQIFHGAINNIHDSVGAPIVVFMTIMVIMVTTVTKKKREKKEVRRNTRTFRIIRHSQTCKQRRNTCCCKFPCEFPQRELTRLFSYVMSPVWTFDTTV